MVYFLRILPALIAALASMVIGVVWFSPFLFGRQWAMLMDRGRSEISPLDGSKNKAAAYLISFIMDAVGAAVLSFVISSLGISNVTEVLTFVFWLWLGFTAPILIGDVIWVGKPWQLFAINAGYRLVSLGAMGVVLSILAY